MQTSAEGAVNQPKVVYEMKVDPGVERGGKKISIFFNDQEPRKVYVYQVVSVNRKGYPSASSNPVTVYWDYSPSAPSRIRAERGDKKVDLSWEPVLGAAGYNVYRRGEGDEGFSSPTRKQNGPGSRKNIRT